MGVRVGAMLRRKSVASNTAHPKKKVIPKAQAKMTARRLQREDSDAVDKAVAGAAEAEKTRIATCDICPRLFFAHEVNNVGNAKYKKSKCKPCFNADKALRKATATQPEARRQHIASMMVNKKNKYHDYIKAFRISLPGEESPEGEPDCCSDVSERTLGFEGFFEEVESFVVEQEVGVRLLMNRREFIGYHVNKLLYKKKVAKRLWLAAKNDPKVGAKNDDLGHMRVPVLTPVALQKIRGIKRSAKAVAKNEVGVDDEENL